MTNGKIEFIDYLIPPDIYWEVLERDNHQCVVCGTAGDNRLHLHHYVYRSAGGLDVAANLVTICMRCHRLWHTKPYLFLVYLDDEDVPHVFMKRMQHDEESN